jgi:protein DGCR14
MASTPSQALTKRQNEQSLMPPPPPPKRIKRPATVLDEDVYTNALSEIIARDYFPGLLEEQVKQEYLDALESKDKAWIASSKKKLTDLLKTPGRARSVPRLHGTERPGDTPTGWQGDTPRSVISTTTTATTTEMAQSAPKEIPDVTNLGLMAFQAKYTSEDNESFNKLLDKQNAKRQEKYAWLWGGNKIPTARQIAYRQREAKRIAAQGGNTERQLAIKTDLDARPAKPDTWKSRPENPLMFMPSSIEDTHETISQKAEAASRAGPKRVVHENTRLPDPSVQHAEGSDVPPSPSISAIKDAIAGRPRLTESEAGYAGGETPRVNGYAFVDEDEPEPDYDHTAAESSELTGDDLRLLGASDSTPNPFSIQENRKREDLHHRMVDRVARTKRAEKAAREVRTPVTPRFASSPRLDFGLRTPAAAASSGQGKALTPAAQKLLQQVGSTPRPAAGSSSRLRNMWTPTPRRAK